MARESLINYELVATAATKLVAAGVEPTARNVRAQLGAGSMSTVLGFLQLWRKAGTRQAAESVLSPEVIVAIGRHTEKRVADATAELRQRMGSLQAEVADVVVEGERTAERALLLERALTAAREQNAELTGRVTQLDNDLRAEKTDLRKAQSALAKTEVERLRAALTEEKARRIAAERSSRSRSGTAPRARKAGTK